MIFSGILSAVLTLAAALLLSSLLQRFISHPIQELSSLATQITKKNDYSLRMNMKYRDEIGDLADAFNKMLSQVQTSRQELLAARDLADQANKLKSQFLANTSHEIRTPINNIIGFTEMLQERDLDPEGRRQAKLIQTSADSLLNVINDILDLSKIEAGKLTLVPAITNLNKELSVILQPFEVQAMRKAIFFEVALGFFPDDLFIDGKRLGQVLINLVNNALKFTPDGGTVKAVGETIQSNTDYVVARFSVSDTGVGIPKESQASIFEAFQQADASTSREYGGTGLGLSISSAIVRMMGGQFTLESELDVGSTFAFEIHIPRAGSIRGLGESSTPKHDAVSSFDSTGYDKPTSEIRILLVEDNRLCQEVAVHRLKKHGFHVILARNGREAVVAFEKETFDAILMDCEMPILDGFAASKKIREIEAKRGDTRIPIAALTAHALEGYREKCHAAGMTHYLTKPIKEHELRDFLAQEFGRGSPS